MMPDSQRGELVGSSQEPPHSAASWGSWLVLKSQSTVSPAVMVVSQTPLWNEASQNQRSPTRMFTCWTGSSWACPGAASASPATNAASAMGRARPRMGDRIASFSFPEGLDGALAYLLSL